MYFICISTCLLNVLNSYLYANKRETIEYYDSCLFCRQKFQPVQLMMCSLEVLRPGRFSGGLTEIPFEAPVKPLLNKVLYETYHGVFINIQYLLKAVIKRNFLNKDIHRTLEFVIENKASSSMKMYLFIY